jgi:hypothetical protein
MSYKLGGIIKMQSGNYFKNQEVSLIKESPKSYQKQFNLAFNPFKSDYAFQK